MLRISDQCNDEHIGTTSLRVAASTHTLLDQCSFEQINICGMIQNNEDSADWVQTLRSGMETDHTLAGRCRGTALGDIPYSTPETGCMCPYCLGLYTSCSFRGCSTRNKDKLAPCKDK